MPRQFLWTIAAVVLWISTAVADDRPRVQILIPGFEVSELPVQLPNLNNLRYRADGKLYALGYIGNIWLLDDTDGDGLEDTAAVYFENKTQLRGPIGMAVIPAGHVLLQRDGKVVPTAQGVIVASKGKVSALLDMDGDNVAEVERVIASGWQEIPPNVDTIGVAVHPVDGSIYFGLGTAAYDNAYLLDESGQSKFDLASERGTVQRIKPDLSGREIVCTGVRFTIGMEFDQHHELFATEQEGATWLPNGNPFDELLHIRPGRHYGFPPRHPRHLPRVFDEPSLFDYRPQHQSTCGITLNLARWPGSKTFGPPAWIGNALITGESRGKLYRTKLVRTRTGEYVAANDILACLSMLAVDCTVSPTGDLLICCHSGGPDWGTGPSGAGKIFRLRATDTATARPLATWAAGPQEVRIAFDRPLDPANLKGLATRTRIWAGPYVTAGERFETLRPGYEVVKLQSRSPRREVAVHAASISADRQTLILATDRQTEAVNYAVQLPGLGREHDIPTAGTLPQVPEIDVAYSLAGVQANWTAATVGAKDPAHATSTAGSSVWTGVVPHLDLEISENLRAGEVTMTALVKMLRQPGTLKLATRVDTRGLFLPVTQPGSKLDYAPEDDRWLSARQLVLRSSRPLNARFRDVAHESSAPGVNNGQTSEYRIELDLSGLESELPLLEVILTSGPELPTLSAEWFARFQDGTSRSGALPLERLLVPWATREASAESVAEDRVIPELAEASWGRGRRVFFSAGAGCASCHVADDNGRLIGPHLANLIHRDYESVRRDVLHPNFSINPDYITYTVSTTAGTTHSGVIQDDGDLLRIGDTAGRITTLRRDEVDELQPSATSIMPEGMADKLGEAKLRDLLAYLLMPPPRMPRDAKQPRPATRTREEVAAIMAGAPKQTAALKPLTLLLVAGAKDHGPGEHDYPAWLKVWSQWLAAAEGVSVDSAMGWPTSEQIRVADTILFYQKGEWTAERATAIDAHLKNGGGLVYIHWAVEGGLDAPAFAQRIGLASNRTQTKYRHGPLEVDWAVGFGHPIARNLTTLSLYDESYWNLVGDPSRVPPLAIGGAEAEGVKPPLFWTAEPERGRVFVSIPGHYSWTFDDPMYRVVLLRGLAWASREPVDRFNPLVPLGAEFAGSAQGSKH